MTPVKLKGPFKRFARCGGVLSFAIFEQSRGDEPDLLDAIAAALPGDFDRETLKALGGRPIRERRFFGDWYDQETGALIKRGSFTTADGRELRDPRLRTLDRIRIMSGAAPCPDAGSGGQFAYAFANPPYGLRARGSEVQALFEEIRDFILPPGERVEILDWCSPRLPEVSAWFRMGMEWWGVFLFTVHVPATGRLTAIAGSTSD